MASAMSDHWSRKTVMQIGVVGTTFFTLLIPLVQTAEQLIIVRLLTGLAGGFAVSAAFPIAAELMPAQHRRTFGAIYAMMLMPVTLPPGRARVATTPAPTGSPRAGKTIGIVELALFAARTERGLPPATIKSTLRPTRSVASAGSRS